MHLRCTSLNFRFPVEKLCTLGITKYESRAIFAPFVEKVKQKAERADSRGTPRTCSPRLYSVCAYIQRVCTPRPGHTYMQRAHACAAKQSELVRRCIATTALFALSGYILLPAWSADVRALRGSARLLDRFSPLRDEQTRCSDTLWLCSWLRYHGCRGKGNCLSSLRRAMFERSLW